MVSVLILVALVCALHIFWPVGSPGERGVVKRSRGARALPPAVVMALFPVATGAFIVVGIDPATVVASLIVVVVAVWQVKNTQKTRTARKQAVALSGFLGLCTGNLRAGVTMVEAMDYSLANLPASDGVTDVLSVSARRARSGGNGAAVLIDAPPTDLQRLGTLWEVSERHGVPLVSLMEQMRARIDTRERHRAATGAALQGPQATAVILALLPAAGVIMGSAMGADPIGVLTGGGIGGVMLVAGVGLGAAGFVLTQKILSGASPT